MEKIRAVEIEVGVQSSTEKGVQSHSEEEYRKIIDSIVEQSLQKLGRVQFLQATLVAFAMFFDAQQSFMSIYTESLPKWHCIANHDNTTSTPCISSKSDICKIPRSTWAWDSHPSSSIISHWELQCAGTFLNGLPQFAFFIGSLMGTTLLSSLADSIVGRKNMLLLSCLCMSIAGIVIIVSPNIWVYSVFKLVIGFWRSSIGTCVLLLLTESVSAKWRTRAGIPEYVSYITGYMSLAGIAYATRNISWRFMYVSTGVLPLVYSVISFPFINESPRWLLLHGRVREAMRILKESETNVDLLPSLKSKEKASFLQLYSSMAKLIKNRWALTRIVWVMLLGIGIGSVYFALALAVGDLGFNIYLAVVFSALVQIPSTIAALYLGNFRRKPSLFACSILSGTCSLLCVAVGDHTPAAKIGLAMVAFFGATTAYFIFVIYIIELFPTCVRFTTTSLVRQGIAVGCVGIPFLISAGRQHVIFTYGVFGIAIICSTLTLLILPETKGIVLCDTMDQQENLSKY